MENKAEDILQFPCEFPLKIIGRNEDDFENFVVDFVRDFVPDLKRESVQSRLSNGGAYLSVSLQFTAQSREQVDSIYMAMTGHKRILFAL